MGKKRDDIDELVAQHRADYDEDEDSDPDVERPRKPFVDHFAFNLLVGFFITLNAVTMGLETDARGEKGDDIPSYWYLIEVVFCLIFLAELVARLYYHRLSFFCPPKRKLWNITDFAIVLMSVIDAFIIAPLGMSGDTVRLVTLLRFVRLMRLIRLVRLLRMFKELWLVANGLIESAKTLCWVAIMILCFIYICAIFTTLVIGKNDELYDPYFMTSGGWDHEVYFRTVPRSMFTLFQIVTFESWSERIVRHVMQKQPAMVIFFVGFIAITSFGLLNIVVGVVVESTLSTSEKDDNKIKRSQEHDRQRVFDHLRDIFEAADEDGSGTLTLGEVQKAINKPEIYNKLKMIDFPVEDPRQIFQLLDYDNSCELSIDEFIAGCIRMKGSAKSKDLLAAQVAVDTMKRHYTFFEKEMKELQEKIALLDDTARHLVFQGEHVFLNLREYRMRHQEMEGGRSSLPVVTMTDITKAPWENPGNKRGSKIEAGDKMKQERLWNEAFNQPDAMAIDDVEALAGASFNNGRRVLGILDGDSQTESRLATFNNKHSSLESPLRMARSGEAFYVGQNVFCRITGGTWLPGRVTSVAPLEVQADGFAKGCAWDEVSDYIPQECCWNCGAPYTSDSVKFCIECGAPRERPANMALPAPGSPLALEDGRRSPQRRGNVTETQLAIPGALNNH
jgi:voltage-gated sodium channel